MASSKEQRKRSRCEGSTADRGPTAKTSKLHCSSPAQDGEDDLDGGSEDLCPPRRCQSIPIIPPSMSEVRIVLLGEDVLLTNTVGNFILGRSSFQTEVPSSVKLHCERASGRVEGRNITIINTPHLYNPQLSQEELTQRVKESITLADPGPHVFLLVLQSGTITREQHDRVRHTLDTYSPLSRERSIVITTGEDQGVISECEVRHHRIHDISAFDKHQVLQLLGKIDMLLKETGGTDLQSRKTTLRRHQDYLTEDTSKTDGEALRENLEENKESKPTPHLKLVLLGMKGVKTSISNLLLSENTSMSQTEHSLMCVKQGEVCGHLITLVEIPAFFNNQLSEQEVMRLTLHCVSICDPGVHAFLIAVPGDALTDEEQSELEVFQSIFGSRVNDHTMLFINQRSQRQQLHESLHSVIKACGGRYGFYSSRTDAAELITHVKDLLKENSSHLYTTAMYTYAQIQTQLQYKREKEYLQQMNNQTQDSLMPPDTLRIVLLGKTGVGKSASGNTILGKEVFTEDLSDESVTRVCQTETAEVCGRQITVIDTPGLFDTSTDNDEIRKEIVKCISMAAPGPHVFLLVLRLGHFTQEDREAVSRIEKTFGKISNMYTIVLFTGGDMLKGKTVEQYIETSGTKLKRLLLEFGNRYHVFNNNDKSSNIQVLTLLNKIYLMVKTNGGSCYTIDMFKDVEEALEKDKERILKEREEQIEREKKVLKMKHKDEMEEMRKEMQRQKERQEAEERRKDKEFKEREEQIKREMAEREKQLRQDFRKRKEEDDLKMKEWMQQINTEREESRKQWERQREEDQKQRDQEKEERKRREEEWRKQREEEEERRRDLENKLKDAEKSKKKELQDLQLSQQRDWKRRMREEEEKRKEQEKNWEKKYTDMEKKWSLDQIRSQRQYERERQKEKKERELKEKKNKIIEEQEKRRIKSDFNEKIRKMEKQLKLQREEDEKERKKKDEQKGNGNETTETTGRVRKGERRRRK